MAGITRRGAFAAIAMAPGAALASGAPGRVAAPEAAVILDGLARVDDGDPAGPRVRVLFSPGCAHSLRMFEATRARRMEAAWRWVPYGGSPSGRAACAAALAAGDMATLEAVLGGGRVTGGDVGAMAAQDDVISRRLGRVLWDATGTALGTPTQVYRVGNGLFMAARGSLPRDALDAMLAAAT